MPSDPELDQRGVSDYLQVNCKLSSETLSFTPIPKVAQRGNYLWEEISEIPLVDSTVVRSLILSPGCVVWRQRSEHLANPITEEQG